MNMVIKHKVLQANLYTWLACKGNKKKRGEITRQISKLLSIHEKSVSRAMKRLQLQDTRIVVKRGRSIYYGKDVDAALYQLWEEMEYPCAENMYSIINEYIGHFRDNNKWMFSDTTTGKLCAMSMGTLKLRISYFREKYNKTHGRSATVSSPLKGMIPIRKSHTWAQLPPGYVQTDSVVHCGDILTGDVVDSVGCVDFATYWNEYTAQWNKGKVTTLESLKDIRARFPFELKEIHPDTGNEFINYHVYGWAQEENIAMTRSEPYKKNDNMCIEERNNSISRKHLGYIRMDDQKLVVIAQKILLTASMLHNHFRPVRRMVSKVRVDTQWKRTFEKVSKTPYQRVLENTNINKETKERLVTVHENLNPLELKRKLDTLKKELIVNIKKTRAVQ